MQRYDGTLFPVSYASRKLFAKEKELFGTLGRVSRFGLGSSGSSCFGLRERVHFTNRSCFTCSYQRS